MIPDRSEWVHCNSCLRQTRHRLVCRQERVDDDEGIPVAEIAYELLQCCGCDEVCMRESGSWVGEEYTQVYPPRVARRSPAWLHDLPADIKGLMEEIYVALHNGSTRLATMGTRAAFDMLAVDQIGDVGNFPAKLNALQQKGVISDKNREVLMAAIDAGSASAHRGHKPGKHGVTQVMDILENVLQSVYVLDAVGASLKKHTPPRQK